MDRREFAAEMKLLPEMLAFIGGAFAACHAGSRAENLVKVACEEVLANVLSYAYDGNPGTVEIACDFLQAQGCFTLRIADSGVPYNPLDGAMPDLDVELDERQVGGLGVYLYKTIMDEVSYSYEDGKNILRLRKYIAEKGAADAHAEK